MLDVMNADMRSEWACKRRLVTSVITRFVPRFAWYRPMYEYAALFVRFSYFFWFSSVCMGDYYGVTCIIDI